MQIVIVTGMSGAGKSTALNVLEDQGYYCVDNMPVPLIPHFAKLAKNQEKHQEKDGSKGHETVYDKIALGVDIRNGDALGELSDMLNNNIDERYKILFLDSSDEVLVKRYKETRSIHPLAKDERVDSAIAQERIQMEFLRRRADYIIDTSQMLTRELKQEVLVNDADDTPDGIFHLMNDALKQTVGHSGILLLFCAFCMYFW